MIDTGDNAARFGTLLSAMVEQLTRQGHRYKHNFRDNTGMFAAVMHTRDEAFPFTVVAKGSPFYNNMTSVHTTLLEWGSALVMVHYEEDMPEPEWFMIDPQQVKQGAIGENVRNGVSMTNFSIAHLHRFHIVENVVKVWARVKKQRQATLAGFF